MIQIEGRRRRRRMIQIEGRRRRRTLLSGQPELPELIEIFEAVSIMEKDGGQFSTSSETRERAGARYCRERAIGRFVHPLQGPVSSSIKIEPDSSYGRVTRFDHLG